ncbi:hypothetical protein Tco_1276587, partial [Tanacetum coccineum]
FGNCSRGFVKVDAVEGRKCVGNGFKPNKIDETEVVVDGLEDSEMDCDSHCEAGESSKMGSNESSKVDISGVVDCEEDGKSHELCEDIVDGSSGIEEDSDGVM